MHRTLQSLIQSRVDEQLSESSPGFQDEKTVDENAPPEMPDPQVSMSGRFLPEWPSGHRFRLQNDRNQHYIHICDIQVLGADVQAEAAAARRAVKKSVENQKI